MSDWYIVEPGGIIRKAPEFLEGARWMQEASMRPFEEGGRLVAETRLHDGTFVSTVFLSLDHGWAHGPPVLFETMIFGGQHDGYQERYCLIDQARAGHAVAVELARAAMPWYWPVLWIRHHIRHAWRGLRGAVA